MVTLQPLGSGLINGPSAEGHAPLHLELSPLPQPFSSAAERSRRKQSVAGVWRDLLAGVWRDLFEKFKDEDFILTDARGNFRAGKIYRYFCFLSNDVNVQYYFEWKKTASSNFN